MGQSYRIFIRCPITAHELDTGITTSSREVLNSSIYLDGTILCSECRKFHSYRDCAYLVVQGADAAEELWRPNP